MTSILLIQCADRAGIIAGVSGWVHEHGGNILDVDQHTDPDAGSFYMRLEFDRAGFRLSGDVLAASLKGLASRLGLAYALHEAGSRPRVAVFAGPTPHCLYDLLLTHRLGELPGDIALVVSNHEAIGDVAGHFDVPFRHVAVARGDKVGAESRQRARGHRTVEG